MIIFHDRQGETFFWGIASEPGKLENITFVLQKQVVFFSFLKRYMTLVRQKKFFCCNKNAPAGILTHNKWVVDINMV